MKYLIRFLYVLLAAFLVTYAFIATHFILKYW